MNFGEALASMNEGKFVSRSGWNGKGMFIFKMSAKSVPTTVEVYPKKLREYFSSQGEVMIKFEPYICMKTADNKIVRGWLASQTDMLAEDWGNLDL